LHEQNPGFIKVGTYVGSGAAGELGGWFGTKSYHPLYFFTNNGGAQMALETDGSLGIGTIYPVSKFQVRGDATIGDQNDTALDPGLTVYGSVQISLFPTLDQYQSAVCEEYAVGASQGKLGLCSSSIRYKENVADLPLGLDAVAALRPVAYDWKKGGQHDLGFIAEEVDEVTPLLTTRDPDGVIQGVRYERITAILVKGMQEQQRQIEELRSHNAALEARVGELERGDTRVRP
jgi:hypothetical protein